jgi:hypothetical protein
LEVVHLKAECVLQEVARLLDVQATHDGRPFVMSARGWFSGSSQLRV